MGEIRANALGALAAWIAGLLTVLSFNLLDDFYPLGFLPLLEGKTFFGIVDFATTNVLIPVGALLIALMAGWIIPKNDMAADYGKDRYLPFGLWYMLIRFAAPVGVALIFLRGITA